MNVIDQIKEAGPEAVAEIAAAAIRRIGALGLEAGQAFTEHAMELAGDPEFEEGLAQINA